MLASVQADYDACRQHAAECEQLCVNTVSGYACACHPGFVFTPDGKNCTPKVLVSASTTRFAIVLLFVQSAFRRHDPGSKSLYPCRSSTFLFLMT